MKNPLVIIEIKNGMIEEVCSSEKVNLIVVDHDTNGEDPCPHIPGLYEIETISKNPADFFNGRVKDDIQQIIDQINDADYPNKRTFLVKDESGREFSGNFTTAQLLTLRDPDEEDMDGERLFEFAEEAQPGDEWNAWGVKITCIE